MLIWVLHTMYVNGTSQSESLNFNLQLGYNEYTKTDGMLSQLECHMNFISGKLDCVFSFCLVQLIIFMFVCVSRGELSFVLFYRSVFISFIL